jgi:LysM repeat protein
MSARPALILASAATILIGCATAQENPNYKFSSKYNPQSEPVQVANAGTVISQETVPASAVQVQPAQIAMPATQSAEIYSAPQTYPVTPQTYPVVSETEQAFDAATMDGTPGYMVMMEQQEVDLAPTTTPVSQAPMVSQAPIALHTSAQPHALPSGPQPVAYDYSQNVVVADTTLSNPSADYAALTYPSGTSYIVQDDDTVYSLSRSLCVGLEDIAAPNGLGADFAIKIGQTLQLPQSRC